jgi:nucleoside-diphosphate-sugar epimerase
MRIVIAGGHGKIALELSRQLTAAGHEPSGIIRNPDHASDLEAVGAVPIVLDLENTTLDAVASAIGDADAVVFAAGAGPGSSAERKVTIDKNGAILLANAAVAAGVRRYVLVSAMSADEFDPASDDVFQLYLKAKSEADAAIRGFDLDWTIVRPGALTDDPPTGLVSVGPSVDRGSVPRADVAAVVGELVQSGAAVRTQFELVSGTTPVATALATLPS